MTAILVIKSPLEIVLASDSKTVITDRPDTEDMKIYRKGNLFFAFSGLGYDTNAGFDVRRSANDYLSGGLCFDENVKKVEEGIRADLKQTYRFWLGNNDQQSFKFYSHHSFILSAFEDGIPKVSVIIFERQGDKSNFDIFTTIVNVENEQKGWTNAERILAFVKDNPNFLKENDPEEAAIELIALEIEADPRYVGYPIHIVKIMDGLEPVSYYVRDE